MKFPRNDFFDWPEMPGLPPPGQPMLIRVVTSRPRQAARQELRKVLRQILAAWSHLPLEPLPLLETSRGPVWLGELVGHSLDISLSYSDGEGWIGLIRSGSIGVDAMRIQPIPEAEDVARHYLGSSALKMIQQSNDPAMAFALSWTEWEARLKCLKGEFSERPIGETSAKIECAVQRWILPNRLIVTTATASKDLSVQRHASSDAIMESL